MNIGETVFVIDSPTTAMMTSIIAHGEAVNVIVEYKDGISIDNLFRKALLRFCRESINLKSLREINVPSPFFLIKPSKIATFRNLLNFKRKMSKINLNKDSNYIGPITSSIISYIDSNNICYLDHGVGDYYNRIVAKSKNKNIIKELIKKGIIRYVLKMPNYFHSKQRHGYTLCKFKDDYFNWIDYRNYQSDVIHERLFRLIEIVNNKSSCLVCMINGVHNDNGIDGDTRKFDDINIEMIIRNCDLNEVVFIKFHPAIYEMSSGVKKDLVKKVHEIGYEVYDIDDFLSDGIGRCIPVEVLIKYCNFNKLISRGSASLWNVSHCDQIIKINDCDYRMYPRLENIEGELYKHIVGNIMIRNVYMNKGKTSCN